MTAENFMSKAGRLAKTYWYAAALPVLVVGAAIVYEANRVDRYPQQMTQKTSNKIVQETKGRLQYEIVAFGEKIEKTGQQIEKWRETLNQLDESTKRALENEKRHTMELRELRKWIEERNRQPRFLPVTPIPPSTGKENPDPPEPYMGGAKNIYLKD